MGRWVGGYMIVGLPVEIVEVLTKTILNITTYHHISPHKTTYHYISPHITTYHHHPLESSTGIILRYCHWSLWICAASEHFTAASDGPEVPIFYAGPGTGALRAVSRIRTWDSQEVGHFVDGFIMDHVTKRLIIGIQEKVEKRRRKEREEKKKGEKG